MRAPLIIIIIVMVLTCGKYITPAMFSMLPVHGFCGLATMENIDTCTKIVRTYLDSDADPYISVPLVPPLSTINGAAICETMRQEQIIHSQTRCIEMANDIKEHAFDAESSYAGLLALNHMNDIHDTCVLVFRRISRRVGWSKYIQNTEKNDCYLASTGGVTKVRCLFIHGAGQTNVKYADDRDASLTSIYRHTDDGTFGKLSYYWNVETQLNGLCDVRYFATNTYSRGWDDASLQLDICAKISRFKPDILFTHSMANPTIAAALYQKTTSCSNIALLNPKAKRLLHEVTWFAIQAPWTGSPAADVEHRICEDEGNVMQKVFNAVMRKTIKCVTPLEISHESMRSTYQSRRHGSLQLSGMKAVAQKYVSGAMCGLSAAPLANSEMSEKTGRVLAALAMTGSAMELITNEWGSDVSTSLSAPYQGNDGLVGFSQCRLDGNAYDSDYRSSFYVGAINHQDGTCHVRDIPGNSITKMPCAWYVARVMDVRKHMGL